MAISDKMRIPARPLGRKPNLPDLSVRTPSGELRDCARFKCQGSVEFCMEGSEIRTYAKMTDLSLAGCYVEMTSTSAPGTLLSMMVASRDLRFQVKGVVRTSDPCLGMGIAFTEISSTDLGFLHRLLLELSEPMTAQVPKPTTILNEKIDAATTLRAIAQSFEKKSFLTREEFLLIVNRQ